MNVFRRFTKESLKKNKTRTLVTLIGITLSMVMFTCVVEAVYSGISFLINAEIEESGAFHGCFSDISSGDSKKLSGVDEINEASSVGLFGWASTNTGNSEKPYLLVKSADEAAEKLLGIKLLEGNMPKNKNEIILPSHLLKDSGDFSYKIGDKLVLDIGTRALPSGEELSPYDFFTEDETLSSLKKKEYTVVGFYKRLSYEAEPLSCPGYTVITSGEECSSYDLFFTLKSPKDFMEFAAEYSKNGNLSSHDNLLLFYGATNDVNITNMAYALAGVLMSLIAIGSVSLIYNSFSISVSERKKQFGILKSVGATKKQIRYSVLYEALLLCSIAVPLGAFIGCAGLGVTFSALKDSFGYFLDSTDSETKMKLVITPVGLLIAALVSVLTSLVSAYIPAVKALKLSPIDALKQTEDIKLTKRNVKSSRLSKKLFGFEGMLASKNFSRNKKRYRATIISLFLSVTLFISASSFCSYLTAAVTGISSTYTPIKADVGVAVNGDKPDEDISQILSVIKSAASVTDACFVSNHYLSYINLDKSSLTEEYINSHARETTDSDYFKYSPTLRLCFVDDVSFKKYCSEINEESERFFDKENPQGIAYNTSAEIYVDSHNNDKYDICSVFKSSALPITAQNNELLYTIGDYTLEYAYTDYYGEDFDENRSEYNYYPTEYYEKYYAAYGTQVEFPLDESLARVFPKEEAIKTTTVKIGALTDTLPYFSSSGSYVVLIYPLSMAEYISPEFTPQTLLELGSFYAKSDNHSSSSTEIAKAFSGKSNFEVYDMAADDEYEKMLVTVITVFSYGFIVLISLIATANVFNTVSTGIALRRREFAMLRSVGLTNKGFKRMMNYECLIYGFKSLLYGLPASVLITYIIYKAVGVGVNMSFYIPAYSIVIAVGSVFAVVFATMIYSTRKIKTENPIDALRNENL